MSNSGILRFLGTGSCFNTKFGNNSAFYFDEKDNHLLLIDCGESVFERLQATGILDKAKQIDILITHLHTDHVGSLPSLIFYCRFVKQIMPAIIYEDFKTMYEYLSITGVNPQFYDFIKPSDYKKYSIRYVRQQHEPLVKAYGYIIEINGKKIYYSGDAKTISPDIISELYRGKIDYLYQDVTRFENQVHMHINNLAATISDSCKKHVYCMHFDDCKTVENAVAFGFNVVTPWIPQK